MGLKDTNAGFEYVHPSDSSTRYFYLNWPPEWEPGGEAEFGRRRRRRQQTAWDFSSRTVWTASASAVETAAATFRFDQYPSDFLTVLGIAADGKTLDYYPDMDLQKSFALEIENVGNNVRVRGDTDRFSHGEWQVRAEFWSSDKLEELYL